MVIVFTSTDSNRHINIHNLDRGFSEAQPGADAELLQLQVLPPDDLRQDEVPVCVQQGRVPDIAV